MRKAWWSTGILASAVVLGLIVPEVPARENGIAGWSGNPASNGGGYCVDCHTGGIAPQVVLVGPATVPPGSMNVYTLSINGGQGIAGGFDVSADGGTLIASDAGTHTEDAGIGNEVVHDAPRAAVSDRVTFSFTWEAPATPGTYTIYAAGNSVDLSGTFVGDNAAATNLQVLVESAPGTPGETSTSPLQPLLATGYDDLTGDVSVSFETGCDTDDNNIYYGPLSLVSTLGYTGEVCDVGTAGTATFDPGSGSYFFLIVGNRATAEGSYGRGTGTGERNPFTGNACGETQDISNSCAP